MRLHLLRLVVASSRLVRRGSLAASHSVVQTDITSWRVDIPLDNPFRPCKRNFASDEIAYLIAKTPSDRATASSGFFRTL